MEIIFKLKLELELNWWYSCLSLRIGYTRIRKAVTFNEMAVEKFLNSVLSVLN